MNSAANLPNLETRRPHRLAALRRSERLCVSVDRKRIAYGDKARLLRVAGY